MNKRKPILRLFICAYCGCDFMATWARTCSNRCRRALARKRMAELREKAVA